MLVRTIVMLAAAGLIGGTLLAEPADAAPGPARVMAQKKGKAKGKDKAAEAPQSIGGIPKIKGRIGLTPKPLAWQWPFTKLDKLYSQVFEKEFVPLYKKTPAGGPAMKALDAELDEKKALLKRNKIDFGTLPTGFDNGPLKGEYSYENGESLSHITVRSGTVRHFFFFKNRLWKIYDEHKLRKGGPYGENYEEALKILTKKFGVAGKLIEPDFPAGKYFQEAHWTDGTTYIRAINREPVLALVWADASIQTNLAKYRPNKPSNPHKMDKDVLAATKKVEPPPEEPKDKKKGKGKK